VKAAELYVPAAPMAGGEKAYRGASFFTAPHPPFGATFTYLLKDSIKSKKDERREKERAIDRDGKDVLNPSWEALKTEDREQRPTVVLVVRDAEGKVVRRIPGATSAGMHRTTWDLRLPGYRPFSPGTLQGGLGDTADDFSGGSFGPLTLPGKYTVAIERRDEKGTTELAGPTSFEVTPLNFATLPASDRAAVLAFARQTGELQRAALGAAEALTDGLEQLSVIRRTVQQTPALSPDLLRDTRALQIKLLDLQERFSGDPTRPRRNEPAPVGLLSRIDTIIGGHWSTTSAPTASHRKNHEIAAAEFAETLNQLRPLLEKDLPVLHQKLEAARAPWSPGRKLPDWKK